MAANSADLSRRAAIAALAAGLAGQASAQVSLDLGGLMRSMKAATIGEKDEVEFGRKLYGPTIDEMGGLYRNRSVQNDLTRLAEPIFATSARKAFGWEIAVIDSNEVNAWCLPGGKIGVQKGLLRYVESEDELAAVIAHEMGHAELSHAAREMRKKAAVSTAAGAASAAAASSSDDGVSVGSAAGLASIDLAIIQVAASGYARESEREADQHIVKVFAATGRDVVRGARFYQTLLDLIPTDSKGRTSLFAGHPETRQRLAALTAGATASAEAPPPGEQFTRLKSTFPTRRVYQRNAAS
jgi:predicted Zn-dependent protease